MSSGLGLLVLRPRSVDRDLCRGVRRGCIWGSRYRGVYMASCLRDIWFVSWFRGGEVGR
jgi:hypothetical protein